MLIGFLKLGTPIILQDQIQLPQGLLEWIFLPWPLSVGFGMLMLWSAAILWHLKARSSRRSPLLLIPLCWFALQCAASVNSLDQELSWLMLKHFLPLIALFMGGYFFLSKDPGLGTLSGYALAGMVLCLWTATEQRMGGLEATRELIYQEPYWQQTYPEDFLQKALEDPAWLQSIRRDPSLLQEAVEEFHLSSGLLSSSEQPPFLERDLGFLEKIGKDRVFGTLFYPNALASGILLCLPWATLTVWQLSHRLQIPSRYLLSSCFCLWGLICLVWSGSKGGWLVGMMSASLLMLVSAIRLKLKLGLTCMLLALAGGAFAWKYADYFNQGATSLSARITYWEAAWDNSLAHPLLGSGPGTFLRVFSQVKSEDAEMARLTHNDYLQQASDSGWPSALVYLAWIGLPLLVARPRNGLSERPVQTAVWLGLCGWALQNFIEFGLYIPGLAWPFFLLLGWLWGTHQAWQETSSPKNDGV